MAKTRIVIEFAYQQPVADAAFAAVADPLATLDTRAVPSLPGVTLDESFAPTPLPGQRDRLQSPSPFDTGALFDLAPEPEASTFIVRGEVDESEIDALAAESGVVGVFSDPLIEPTMVCPGDPPVGTDADVERLLCTSSMRRIGMDATGVLVAIVDTGVNVAYLNARGKTPTFDAARSWVPRAGLTPGSLPVGHGTMCAFDACIAAPQCTLLDIALLRSTATGPTPMSGILSDGIRAYRHLLDLMLAPRRPGESRSMVVNNSWGMFHPSWDFPPGHPGNYSDNPNHPFNRIVASLERAGADILFAAGNCGSDCPDGRCQNVTSNAIYGANGHSAVLCVAGVDTTKTRVGYSTTGPGRLTRNKPDLSGYTHFRGSGVYSADGGTSAATPVVAGVVAAVRSKRPYDPANPATHPAAIRNLMRSSAQDLGAAGYDFLHGHGVVDGCALYRRLRPIVPPIDICRRYPWICRGIDLCRIHPEICERLRLPPRIPAFPPPAGLPEGRARAEVTMAADESDIVPAFEALTEMGIDPVELSYRMGLLDAEGTSTGGSAPATAGHEAGARKDCGCKP